MVVGCADAAIYLRAAFKGHGWWLLRDALQFSEEEAGVRWLVVTHTLPGHSVAVFMVVPQRGDGMWRRIAGDIDTQDITYTVDNLLAPVTYNITKEAGVVL